MTKSEQLARGCPACGAGRESLRVGRARTTSGREIFPYFCTSCRFTLTVYEQRKVALRNGPLPDVMTSTEAAGRDFDRPPCEVCGAMGTEEHHWAPRAIFGDECNAWPTSFLCVGCHQRWHQLVTPAKGGR